MRTKTAVAFGSFDILHPGHVHYLEQASRYGRLFVVVARDRSIEMLKHKKPVMDERARLEMVGAIRFVHKAMLGNRIAHWNDVYEILPVINPDVIVLGYDQRVDMPYLKQFLARHHMKVRIVRIRAYKSGRFKSSKIKDAMFTGQ
ncbi:MAG: FAD synthase [Candidatus Micrarchaeota archaeon]|nr:FAD synthase [Candidatus Micrarchaeota archaeon]